MVKRQEDTICYKVSRIIEDLEKSMETRTLDAGKMAKLLHEIRMDASRMERGLKLRKDIMEKANLEEKYQKEKGKKHITGINKIATEEEKKMGRETFEVTIIQGGEIVYQNKAHAGAISLVEKIEDIDNTGAIIGQTQKLIFGHPLAYWFAFDQLRQGVEGRNVEIMQAMKAMIGQHGGIDKQTKNKVLSAMKSMNI